MPRAKRLKILRVRQTLMFFRISKNNFTIFKVFSDLHTKTITGILEKARLDFTYVLSDGVLTRITDYRKYLTSAEEKAAQLLKLL